MITSGAQEGLSKAINMCMHYGDPVIIPDPAYTGAIDLVIFILPTLNKLSKELNYQHSIRYKLILSFYQITFYIPNNFIIIICNS